MEVVNIKSNTTQSEIDAMNARMDSFVDMMEKQKVQVASLYTENVNRIIQEVKKYDPYFKQVKQVMEQFEAIVERVVELESQDKRMINDISENSKFYSSLRVDVTTCKNDQKNLEKKMKMFEGYFSRYNFESIVDELEKLDEEYQEKVQQIISKLSARKSSTEIDSLFKNLNELPLTVRTYRCLEAEGFKFIGDIICNKKLKWSCPPSKRGYSPLLKIPNFGRKSYMELVNYLGSIGYVAPIVCEEYWVERQRRTGKEFKLDF